MFVTSFKEFIKFVLSSKVDESWNEKLVGNIHYILLYLFSLKLLKYFLKTQNRDEKAFQIILELSWTG